MAGLYIHIPFCKQACYYCDFHFSTNNTYRLAMCEAMAKEITMQKEYLGGEALETIYFGGGTPSALNFDEFKLILESIRSNFNLEKVIEVTVEANPDDLNQEKLQFFKDCGVNRLSIGVQSFQEKALKFLNRAHDSKHAIQSIIYAREKGFDNFNIDIIFAIPGQEITQLIEDLTIVKEFLPSHISAYSLTVEEKTVFGRWANQNKFQPVGEDENVAQFEYIIDFLEGCGYQHYEISNFSRPGFESKHNSNYWKQRSYLGIGPGAHSYNGESRLKNIANNHLYMAAIEKDEIPFTLENLTRNDKINEYIMTSLRTSWGCDTHFLKNKLKYDLLQNQHLYIYNLLKSECAEIDGDFLKLKRKGKFIADKISSDLFII